MADNTEFGELRATVAAIDRRLEDVRTEVRAGFQQLEGAISRRLDGHSQRLRGLELWRAAIGGAVVLLAVLWAVAGGLLQFAKIFRG